MRAGLTRPTNLRRLRIAAAIALASSVLLIALTVEGKAIGWVFPNGWHVGVHTGTLSLGYELPSSNASFAGPYVAGYWWANQYPLAWRPYHAVQRIHMDRRGRAPVVYATRSVVTPMWPAPLCSAALLGWAHGRLSGLRAARSRSCLSCGYDLSPMLATPRSVRCPECGTARSEPPTEPS
ncbi:MAG: hypothetical protein C0475_04835 [Planctomyces sp.]|nr:hypothetical protein [Planctomyces sp.]